MVDTEPDDMACHLCACQVWAVERSKGNRMPSGGTLLIGREQDCMGGCFDSASGGLLPSHTVHEAPHLWVTSHAATAKDPQARHAQFCWVEIGLKHLGFRASQTCGL